MHNKRPPSSDRSRHLAITRSRCCHRFCLFLSWFPPSPSAGLLGRESCPVTVAPRGCFRREASVCRPDHTAGQDLGLLRDRTNLGRNKPSSQREQRKRHRARTIDEKPPKRQVRFIWAVLLCRVASSHGDEACSNGPFEGRASRVFF